MSDAKTSKRPRLTQGAVMKRIRFWKRRMLLTHWRFAVEFGPDKEEGSEASCNAAPEYLHATLRFDLDLIPVDEIDSYVVHELAHCQVWGLANAAHSMCGDDAAKLENVRTHEEGLATYIERLVTALWQEGEG